MSPLQLDEPFAGESHLEVRIEIAVGPLGIAEQSLGLTQLFAQPVGQRGTQRRIGECPGDRLQPLVNVAVEERQVVDVAAGTVTRSQLQVVEVAGLVQPVLASWDAHLTAVVSGALATSSIAASRPERTVCRQRRD